MLDLFKDIFTSDAGSFGSMFAIFALFFWLAYKSGKVIEKYKIIDTILGSIDKIKDDISEIKAFMKVARQDSSGLAKAHSPISLTKKGNGVYNDLHVDRAICAKWENINKNIKDRLKEEDNPYDIQVICFEFGENYSRFISNDDFDFIKKYAFNKGYSLSDFDIIFGISIRDKYFSENNISVSDVDNHDPNKEK
jgi:hypothetical protein